MRMDTKSTRLLFLKIMIITTIPLIIMGAAFCVSVVFFSQRLPEEVKSLFWDRVVSALWIWLVILVVVMIIILFCTMYMAGAIIRHFKDEEKANTDKIVAKHQTEFVTLVTREIRDPVDAITVLSDRILEEETSPEVRAEVLGIKEAGNSMMISFDSIYDYTKLESGEIEITEDEYELTKVVSSSCDKVKPGIERKHLDFRVSYDESMPNCLKGDYEKISQILDNLLENAVKYTYEGSISLEVGYRTITPDKIDVNFTITDTGVGIRREDAKKLFLSIGKVGQSKNVSIKGTGLGLLICKRLVSLLDGRISVDSEIGKGSTFRFTVPQDVESRKSVGEYMQNDI